MRRAERVYQLKNVPIYGCYFKGGKLAMLHKAV